MNDDQKQSLASTQAVPASGDEPLADAIHPVASDFDNASRPGDLWPEAADARCSQHAALFADTQPAPLSVV